MKKPDRKQIFREAIHLLKTNIITPDDKDSALHWDERTGPWGKNIKNLLKGPAAGRYITPNKNTFVGQWYWDTMAINTGLLRSEDEELKGLAFSMLQNLFMLYDKAGLVPNAADDVQVSRSQPPFLTSMVLDIAQHTFQREDGITPPGWHQTAYGYCKNELRMPWEEFRSDYGFRWFDRIAFSEKNYSPEETLSFFRPESRSDYRVLRSVVRKKLSANLDEKIKAGYKSALPVILKALSSLDQKQRNELCKWLYSRRLLVCSGMDFTATYGLKELPGYLGDIFDRKLLLPSDMVYSSIAEISPLDLNCLIYKYYKDMLHFTRYFTVYNTDEGGYYQNETEVWKKKIATQKDLIYKYHFSRKESCFYNYNIRSEKEVAYSHLTHSAYPLYCELVEEDDAPALVSRINKLTVSWGIKSTETKTGFQWDYNMWPLQTWITVQGLIKYGFTDEAEKIALGYVKCVEKVFQHKGTFYEKYNAVNGSIETDGRYPSEPGFSWGASIYIAMVKTFDL